MCGKALDISSCSGNFPSPPPSLPFPSSLWLSVCSWMLQAPQRWPQPCCSVLCWWGGRVKCQGHLADKRSRCLTLTNSPAGLGWASPSALHCYIDSKCWDLQPLQKNTWHPLHSPSQPTHNGAQRVTSICLSSAAASVTCSFGASFHFIFGHRKRNQHCQYAACIYLHKRDHCQKLMVTLKLSYLCIVGCGGCNLKWKWRETQDLGWPVFKKDLKMMVLLKWPYSAHFKSE